jgi:hypothetical protein
MKKEVLIYLFILTVGAIIIHPDLLYAPLARFEWINERGNYYHPFVISTGVYLLIGVIRLTIRGIKHLYKRSSKS